MILHIIPRDLWSEAQQNGSYHAASLEREGFIHFSRPEQVVGTANRFYTGQRDLLLLVVDPAKVNAEVRYEPPAENPNSSERFPHIYGELNLDAVIRIVEFPPAADGTWTKLPDEANP